MTVQVGGGYIDINAKSDFVRTTRGVTWAIKARDIDGTQFVSIFIQAENGSWSVGGGIDNAFDIHSNVEGFDVVTWFKTVLLPALNKWLASTFPPLKDAPPEPAAGTPLEQADRLINTALVLTTNADGTVTASMAGI